MLDNTHNLPQSAPAPAQSGVGIGVPVTVAKATSSSSVAFLLPVFRQWRSGAGSRKARRSLFRYANLRPAVTRLASGDSLNRGLRKQHMTHDDEINAIAERLEGAA